MTFPAIDWDRYLASRGLTARNETSHRYDEGLRVIDCPHCGDRRGRGWFYVDSGSVGCLNSGCWAEPKVEGGAVAWAQKLEHLPSRASAWAYLLREFRSERQRPSRPRARPIPSAIDLPPSEPLDGEGLSVERARAFCARQWGLTPADCAHWGLRVCMRGRYAQRVIIPIALGGQVVAFQARSISGGTPKYLTESPAGTRGLLFGYNDIMPGEEVMLVEGPGDVMGWTRQGAWRRQPAALGLLGTQLTAEKLARLAALEPRRVILALDADASRRTHQQHEEELRAWGFQTERGQWQGGKDAGSGALLRRRPITASLSARLRARLS